MLNHFIEFFLSGDKVFVTVTVRVNQFLLIYQLWVTLRFHYILVHFAQDKISALNDVIVYLPYVLLLVILPP